MQHSGLLGNSKTISAPNGIRLGIEIVTVETAQKWLKASENLGFVNRKASTNNTQFLSYQMTNGQWQFTGDPIRLRVDGAVIDGQHRLKALIHSGLPYLDFLVIRNVPNGVFEVLDTGKKRGAKDVLDIHGYKSSSLTASIVKNVILWQRDNFSMAKRSNPVLNPHGQKNVSSLSTKPTATSFVTNGDILAFIEVNKSLLDVANFVTSSPKRQSERLISPSLIGMFLFLFMKSDKNKAYQFWRFYYALETNDVDTLSLMPFGNESPVKYMFNLLLDIKKGTREMPASEIKKVIIMCWNSFKRDEKRQRIAKIPADVPVIQ